MEYIYIIFEIYFACVRFHKYVSQVLTCAYICIKHLLNIFIYKISSSKSKTLKFIRNIYRSIFNYIKAIGQVPDENLYTLGTIKLTTSTKY